MATLTVITRIAKQQIGRLNLSRTGAALIVVVLAFANSLLSPLGTGEVVHAEGSVDLYPGGDSNRALTEFRASILGGIYRRTLLRVCVEHGEYMLMALEPSAWGIATSRSASKAASMMD